MPNGINTDDGLTTVKGRETGTNSFSLRDGPVSRAAFNVLRLY